MLLSGTFGAFLLVAPPWGACDVGEAIHAQCTEAPSDGVGGVSIMPRLSQALLTMYWPLGQGHDTYLPRIKIDPNPT